jgi:hypothetical protein
MIENDTPPKMPAEPRQAPSAEAAGQFWRDMQCEGLRPQVRRLLESLNVAPDPVGLAWALTCESCPNCIWTLSIDLRSTFGWI